ncbi:MAG: pyrroline-5-carboxylate reductase [Actinomycetes bacterium]
MAFDLIIVGGGRMGGALAKGLLAAGWCTPDRLAIIESAVQTRDELTGDLPGVTVLASLELEHVDPEVTSAILAVKPDQAEGAARLIGAVGIRRVLSVVAGLSTKRIEATLPNGAAVIRSMPNTPVLVGKGVSAISGGDFATKDDLDWATSVLGAVGIVVRVSEKHMDTVTGLSGPMPAYLYMVVEALVEAGVHQGLTREVSRQLVIGTFEGSAALLAASDSTPEELRSQVTSPGGTTAAGLRMLEARAVRAAFLEAVAAASERSRQLGR